MKKFLPVLFFLPLFFESAQAQQKTTANSLSLVIAPNLFQHFSGDVPNNYSYDLRTGYSFGLDYAYDFHEHWHLKIGMRYNQWNRDWQLGAIDSESKYSQRAICEGLQLLSGMGWHSKAGKWRWNTDAELGITTPTRPMPGNGVARLTAGLGIGGALAINRHFHLFVQPSGRFIFNGFYDDGFSKQQFLTLQLETGIRYAF